MSNLIIDLAERALRFFGGSLTREQAAAVLPMWRYYGDLTQHERDAVVERFAPKRRFEPGNSGPGW